MGGEACHSVLYGVMKVLGGRHELKKSRLQVTIGWDLGVRR
jgi:hypothetical protein